MDINVLCYVSFTPIKGDRFVINDFNDDIWDKRLNGNIYHGFRFILLVFK